MKRSSLLAFFLFLSACATAPDESVSENDLGDVSQEVSIVDSNEVTGIFVSGFEASILYPCGEPGEQWWMGMNAEFSERYRAMIEPATESRGGRGPYVLVRVEGDMTRPGEYGHLGAYSREFTVTTLRDMRRLSTEPDGDLAEWVRGQCADAGDAN